MGCSWKTYRRAANQKMAGCRVCLCLPFCIIPFSTLCLFLSVCLQSEGRVSFTVTTCEIVFHEDGCFLLYSWHPGKHSHLQNCLIWMPWRRTHIRTSITRNRSLGVHTETHGHKCTAAHLQTPTHVRTHFKGFFFFSLSLLPQRQCMAGVLLLLMMKSGSDSATLSRVDALQHSAAMLRKFSVSPHWEHGGFSSSTVHQCTLAPLPPYCFISGVS